MAPYKERLFFISIITSQRTGFSFAISLIRACILSHKSIQRSGNLPGFQENWYAGRINLRRKCLTALLVLNFYHNSVIRQVWIDGVQDFRHDYDHNFLVIVHRKGAESFHLRISNPFVKPKRQRRTWCVTLKLFVAYHHGCSVRFSRQHTGASVDDPITHRDSVFIFWIAGT